MNINDLPEHVLIHIFQYLPQEDLCLNARCVCHHWCALTYDMSLWKVMDLTSKVNSINDDVFLGILKKVQHSVEYLNVKGLKLSNEGLKHTGIFCSRLKYVDLSGTMITDEGLCYLTDKYPCLEQLLCFKCKKLEHAYQSLSKLKCLKVFYDPYEDCISKPEDFPPEIFHAFSESLENVRFSSELFGEESLLELCITCSNVTSLELPGCSRIRDEGIIAASEYMNNITYLDISRLQGVTDKGLKILSERCTKLEKLNVSECRLVTDIGICDLVTLAKGVKHLVLNEDRRLYGNITDFGLVEIAEQCCNLMELVICSCPSVTDVGIQALSAKCHQLKVLDVAACLAITDQSLFAIASGLLKLEKFCASECVQLTAKGLNCLLKKCTNLIDVELQTCMYLNNLIFTSVSHAKLQGNNSNCISKEREACNLLFVDFSFCSRFTGYSVEQIATQCHKLRCLSLRGCHLVDDNAIVKLAKCCHLLEGLDIAGGSILQSSGVTDVSLHAIANHCKKLEFLSIDKVQKVTLDGIIILAMRCSTLYKVYITVGGHSSLKLKQIVEVLVRFRRKAWVYDVKDEMISDQLIGDFIVKFLPVREHNSFKKKNHSNVNDLM